MKHEDKLKRLEEKHIASLTKFVKQIRKSEGLTNEVPYFDPCDGGRNACILFLLEAPGPKAVNGFVSQDNPDQTARNLKCFLREAKISRRRIVIWNVVPWYIGVRTPSAKQIQKGMEHLRLLLRLLKKLKVIVLLGDSAQQIRPQLLRMRKFDCFSSPHPSPQNLNHHPEYEAVIKYVFIRAKRSLPKSIKRDLINQAGYSTTS